MRYGTAIGCARLLPGLLVIMSIVGCYRGRSQLLVTPVPPEELYRCMQLELARAEYTITAADRASGWLKAQRRVDRIISPPQWRDIYATVIPDPSGGSSHLQVTSNSPARDDADRFAATCIASAGAAGESSSWEKSDG